MNRLVLFSLFLTTAFGFAAPPEQDRQAILAMAGKFHVDFDFKETVQMVAEPKHTSPPYHEEAYEVVVIAEDTPERITLQHLLVVGKPEKPMVIKHWAQIWTWQDTDLLDYAGSDGDVQWKHLQVSTEQAAGKWSQLVTSIDDSPRYEALGRWSHDAGVSSWTSEPTRRPLPRREEQKNSRDDYDYLLGTNRHTLTPSGWVHFQDSRKVVDRDGRQQTLSFESGLNVYRREDSPLAAVALQWWEKNSKVWGEIRNFWSRSAKNAGPVFRYHEKQGEVLLSKKLGELEAAGANQEAVQSALAPYVSADN
jgi:hypothetical protein